MLNKYAKAAMKRTGKPYGGHLSSCVFIEVPGRGVVAVGDLSGDPANRFGFRGSFGVRTSLLVTHKTNYIETLNTIYTYTELGDQ